MTLQQLARLLLATTAVVQSVALVEELDQGQLDERSPTLCA